MNFLVHHCIIFFVLSHGFFLMTAGLLFNTPLSSTTTLDSESCSFRNRSPLASLVVKSLSTTHLCASSGRNIFGGFFGRGVGSPNPKDDSGSKTDIDAIAIFHLPATSLKVGPLKFYLQIFLVGEQNNPVQGSWVMNPNDKTGSLDMYYTDGTGMVSIVLMDDNNDNNNDNDVLSAIQVMRYGQRPSLPYRLQESVLLHSLLDELEAIAFAGDIDPEKRLVQFANGKGDISKARETLPARKEDTKD
jgi:hypothetical protein